MYIHLPTTIHAEHGQCTFSSVTVWPCCVGENELLKFRKKQILLFLAKQMVCFAAFAVLSYFVDKKGSLLLLAAYRSREIFWKKLVHKYAKAEVPIASLQILRMAFNTYARRCKSTGVLRVFIVWKGRHEQISVISQSMEKTIQCWDNQMSEGLWEDLENIIKPEPKFLLVIFQSLFLFLEGHTVSPVNTWSSLPCMAAHQVLQWPERKWCLKIFLFYFVTLVGARELCWKLSAGGTCKGNASWFCFWKLQLISMMMLLTICFLDSVWHVFPQKMNASNKMKRRTGNVQEYQPKYIIRESSESPEKMHLIII